MAPNLVPGKANKFREVYLHDTITGTTTRVCVAPDGSPCENLSTTPSIDADGARLAYVDDGREEAGMEDIAARLWDVSTALLAS